MSSTARPSSPQPRLSFSKSGPAFRAELLRRVDGYFEATGKSRHATPFMWLKSAFWVGGLLSILGVLSFVSLPGWLAVVLSLGSGFFVAGMGFNVGHDAIHGAYSARRGVNALLGRTFDLMGASSLMWAWAHNIVHHTYTNVPGVDHDLEPGFFLRFYKKDRPSWGHRLQHVYGWVLYCFTSAVWVFKKDFAQLLETKARTGKAPTRREVADVLLGKALHFSVFLGLPFLGGLHAWWQVLAGYALSLAVSGFTAAVVFQLAHVVEGPAFPSPAPGGAFEDDFYVHQLKTTSNFAAGNPVATFVVGGLNHQVEHHLFPRICHVHYPALAPIVRECAREFGVPYYEHRTFLAALASHARLLREIGRASTPSAEPAPAPASA
ncbi:MAG: acyl-CoA desaturase [Myxococcota bacterium]